MSNLNPLELPQIIENFEENEKLKKAILIEEDDFTAEEDDSADEIVQILEDVASLKSIHENNELVINEKFKKSNAVLEDFQSLKLPNNLLKALAKLEFNTPTPIQSIAIPIALAGQDILGTAQTGTGKTAAFAIPLIEKLIRNPQATALVLTPTRELATQVMAAIRSFLGEENIKAALLIGGDAMPKQLQQLRNKPRIIVGTPGRVTDHLKRRTLHIGNLNYFVLDEIDRMLDMGFSIQIEQIYTFIKAKPQTLFFSATLPKNIIKLAEKYLDNPQRVSVGSTSNPVERIKQEMISIKDSEKYEELKKQLDARTGSVIVFVKTKMLADQLADDLYEDEHNAAAIHGDLRHSKRESVIKGFKNHKYRILIATDVASRGLDIPHIEHVINYDLPQCPEDYIHRIGRTARAGKEGNAVAFVSPSDYKRWIEIQRLINPEEAKKLAEQRRSSGNNNRNDRGDRRGSGNGRRDGSRGGFGRDSRNDRGRRDFRDNRDRRSDQDKPNADIRPIRVTEGEAGSRDNRDRRDSRGFRDRDNRGSRNGANGSRDFRSNRGSSDNRGFRDRDNRNSDSSSRDDKPKVARDFRDNRGSSDNRGFRDRDNRNSDSSSRDGKPKVVRDFRENRGSSDNKGFRDRDNRSSDSSSRDGNRNARPGNRDSRGPRDNRDFGDRNRSTTNSSNKFRVKRNNTEDAA